MITLTEKATVYIKKMISDKKGLGLRLSIKKTGCSGFSYAPSILMEVNESDVCIAMNEVKIYIDPLWQHLLEGIEIDFVEEDKSGLKQKKLTFKNPKESSRCGCGESFHIGT